MDEIDESCDHELDDRATNDELCAESAITDVFFGDFGIRVMESSAVLSSDCYGDREV